MLHDAPGAGERLLLWLAGGLLLLAMVFYVALGGFGAFASVQAFSANLPDWLWASLTVLGDERVLLALMLPYCKRYPKVFWSLILAAVLAGLASRGIKVWLAVPRPAAVLGTQEITIIGSQLLTKSFPSGHTVSAAAFAGVWLGALGGRRMWSLFVMAGLVGLSRVAVGAHWPFDTLAGACLGTLGAWAGLQLARRWRWGLRIRPHRFLVCLAAVAVASLPFEDQGYPGSLALRLAVCLWGLAGFAVHYLLPLLRGGWRGEDRFEA